MDDAVGERLFHAYDFDNAAACQPEVRLDASADAPNEGSRFCGTCMDVARRP